MKAECKIDGCERPMLARGFCDPHYRRVRRTGSPDLQKTANGALMKWIIEVAVPFEGGECLSWPFSKYNNGYGKVTVNRRHHVASRLICEIVKGQPPAAKYEAAHSCGEGRRGCVNPHHLSWKTRTDNQADRVIHGTYRTGERVPSSKLTIEQVAAIRALAGQEKAATIGARFGISRGHTSAIIAGQCWSAEVQRRSR